ncbi:PREDICTED: syndecan-4 [Gavialis gangeticus]|uniref:syndecan-4 n=1 Tax=Gavialis gangeticus TaxID=94835 RepID=UPI00092E23F9|nr:PREDICTED: syndecan-4 [Gavialis gangeticus]
MSRCPARALCAAMLLLLLAVAAVSAESVRETMTMDPQLLEEDYSSGALPDDEDVGRSSSESTIDDDDYDLSGSGDEDDFDVLTSASTVSPVSSSDNYIPEDGGERTKDMNKNPMQNNEIVPGGVVPLQEENLSNKISMASTGSSSIFERTEVLAALIAGGAVGLLFAIFLILLLVYRMKKKDEGSYDLGKKPIYKKAPTNEFYA